MIVHCQTFSPITKVAVHRNFTSMTAAVQWMAAVDKHQGISLDWKVW